MLTVLRDPVHHFFNHAPFSAIHKQYADLLNLLKQQTARAAALMYAVNWIRSNPQYVGAATIIGEYAAKTAMYRLLPNEYATMCAHSMKMLGIDVESVNVGTLGAAALEMAMPIVTDYYYYHPHGSMWDLAVHTVREIIDKIKAIADMDTENDPGHAKMASFIHANPHGSVDAFKRAAIDAYGTGAHWLALALPQIERGGEQMIERSAEAIAIDLKVAYAHWTSWAKRSVPVLMNIEHDMANFITSATHGLFVASQCAPPGAPMGAVCAARVDTSRQAEAGRVKSRQDEPSSDKLKQVATGRDKLNQVATSRDKMNQAATVATSRDRAATSL